jgi:hypothetical protein
MDREEQRKRNRERMPETAAIVDEWRLHFPGATFDWVCEGGIEQGTPHPTVRTMNADQWLHYVKTGEKPCSM